MWLLLHISALFDVFWHVLWYLTPESFLFAVGVLIKNRLFDQNVGKMTKNLKSVYPTIEQKADNEGIALYIFLPIPIGYCERGGIKNQWGRREI